MQQVTLLFLRRDNEMLLAMKKRGFGVGNWNGVGGKVEPGETIEQAAVRECQEEIGVIPTQLIRAGRLAFSIAGNPSFGHDVHIFVSKNWKGTPIETDEMRPQWFKITEIPYDLMWKDDPLWLPHVLAGRLFSGTVMLSSTGEVVAHDIQTNANLG